MEPEGQQQPPSGWLTLAEVAARCGNTDLAATRAWVCHQLRDRSLIAVDDRGTIRVPAFMLTAGGDPPARAACVAE